MFLIITTIICIIDSLGKRDGIRINMAGSVQNSDNYTAEQLDQVQDTNIEHLVTLLATASYWKQNVGDHRHGSSMWHGHRPRERAIINVYK